MDMRIFITEVELMTDGKINMIDKVAAGMTTSGVGTMFAAPDIYFKIIGAVVGVLGIILGYVRWKESKRANDLTARQLDLKERELNAKDKSEDSGQADG